MKRKPSKIETIGVLTVALALATGISLAGSCSESSQPDIVTTAVEAGSFTTLVAAVEAAGLVDALKGDGPFTVFAPTDEAFARLPKGTLETLLKPENKEMLAGILTYHVAPGSLTADRIVTLDRVKTLNGQRPAITVHGDTVMVGQATVTGTDIMTSNGVIHVIDRVLMPEKKDIIDTAVGAGSFKTLAAALDAAGLISALQGEGPFTVFAPTDAAFAKLPAGTVETLLKPESKDRLTAILTYHVAAGDLYSSDARPGPVPTLEGSELKVSKRNGKLMIDQAQVVTADIVASNGVIHVIDEVILPAQKRSSYSQTAQELIRLAIDRGVPLFNQGQVEACAAIYEVAAQGLVASSELDAAARATLTDAMVKMEETHDARRQAWIMRHALDDVMESLRADSAKMAMYR